MKESRQVLRSVLWRAVVSPCRGYMSQRERGRENVRSHGSMTRGFAAQSPAGWAVIIQDAGAVGISAAMTELT